MSLLGNKCGIVGPPLCQGTLSVDRSVTQHAVNEKMLTSHTLPGFIHPGTDGRSVAEAWHPSLLHVVSEPLATV